MEINIGDPATDQLAVVITGSPTLLKSFTPDPVAVGGTVNLNFTISNPAGGTALSDLSFSDDLDDFVSGLVATGLPQIDVCGVGSTLSLSPTETSLVIFTGGSLPTGGQCVFDVTLEVPLPPTVGTFTNTTSSLREGPVIVASPAVATLTIINPTGFGTTGVAVTGTSSGINCIDNTIVGFAAATVGCDFEVGTTP